MHALHVRWAGSSMKDNNDTKQYSNSNYQRHYKHNRQRQHDNNEYLQWWLQTILWVLRGGRSIAARLKPFGCKRFYERAQSPRGRNPQKGSKERFIEGPEPFRMRKFYSKTVQNRGKRVGFIDEVIIWVSHLFNLWPFFYGRFLSKSSCGPIIGINVWLGRD